MYPPKRRNGNHAARGERLLHREVEDGLSARRHLDGTLAQAADFPCDGSRGDRGDRWPTGTASWPTRQPGYHPIDPGMPLNGPTTQLVIQPP